MSSVTFSTSVGGDGSTVTDDNNATTGLREGGWKTRFVPCFTQQVAVANYVVTKAGEAAASQTAAAQSAIDATNNGAAQVALAAAQVSLATAQATAAAASYDSFDDRYLGAKSSDPSIDNDGNALLTGAIYWNTASNVMKVWSGSAWVSYNPAISYLPLSGGTMTGAITFAAGQFGTNVNTFLTTPSSANLAAALTDETGSGAAVFANTPTLIAPILGTPTSGNLSNCTNAVAYGLKSATTTVSVSGATAPTSGQALIATSSTEATWQSLPSSIASIARSAKTSAYTIVAGDKGTLIEVTSGTFTLSLTAAATLGSGWWCYVSNIGSGLITIDPNSTETITVNGTALSTWVQWTTEIGILQCNGTGFNYYQMQKGYTQQTVSSAVASVNFTSGVNGRKKLRLTSSNVDVTAGLAIKLQVNGSDFTNTSKLYAINTSTVYATFNAGRIEFPNEDCSPSGGTDDKKQRASADINFDGVEIIATSHGMGGYTGAQYKMNTSIGYLTSSSMTSVNIVTSNSTLSAGTYTLTEL